MSERRYQVKQEFSNAWALYRRVWNACYEAWMEQPVVLYRSEDQANAEGKSWAEEGEFSAHLKPELRSAD